MAFSGSTAVRRLAALAMAGWRFGLTLRAVIAPDWRLGAAVVLVGLSLMWQSAAALAAERVTVRIRVELTPARTPGAVLTVSGGRLIAAMSQSAVEGDAADDLTVDTKRNRARLTRATPRARDALDLVVEPGDEAVLRMEWHTVEAQRDAETIELKLSDLARGDRQIRIASHGLRLTVSRVINRSDEAAETVPPANEETVDEPDHPEAARLELRVNLDHLVFSPREPLLIEAEYFGALPEASGESPPSLEWRLMQAGTDRVVSYDYEPLVREGDRNKARLSLRLPSAEGVLDGEVRVVQPGGQPATTARLRCVVLTPSHHPVAQSEIGPYESDDSRSGLRWPRGRGGEGGRLERTMKRLFGRRVEEAPPVFSWRGLEASRPHRLDLTGTSERQAVLLAEASEPNGFSWESRQGLSSLLVWPGASGLEVVFPQAPAAVSLHRPAVVLRDESPVWSRWWGVRVDNPAAIEELARPVAGSEPPEAVWVRGVDRLLESVLIRGENAILVEVMDRQFPLLAMTGDGGRDVPVLQFGANSAGARPVEELAFDRLEVLLRRATAADVAVIPLVSLPRTGRVEGLPTAAAEPVLRAIRSRYGGHAALAGIALRLDGDSPWEYRSRDEGWAGLATEFAKSRPVDPARPGRPQVSWHDPTWPEWRAQATQIAWQQLAQRVTEGWSAGRLVLDIHPAPLSADEARDAAAPGHRFDPLQARGLSPRSTASPPGRQTLLYLIDGSAWAEERRDRPASEGTTLVGWSEGELSTGSVDGDRPEFLPLAYAPAPVDEVTQWLSRTAGEAVFSSLPLRFVRREAEWDELRDLFRQLPAASWPGHRTGFGNDGLMVRAIRSGDQLVLWAINATGLAAEVDVTIEGCPQSLATAIGRGGDEPLACPPNPSGQMQTTLSLAPRQIWRATLISPEARLTAARVRRPQAEISRLSKRIDTVTARLAELEQIHRAQPGERYASGFESTPTETLAWEPATQSAPWSLDRTVMRDGRHAVTLASAESEIVSRELPLTRAPQIEVTAWMKAQRSDFAVEIVAETTRGDAAWTDRRKLSTGTNWERKSVVFTLPETARGQPLRVRIRGLGTGRLWVDDVVIQSDSEAAGEYRALTRTLAAANVAWKEGRYADCERLLRDSSSRSAATTAPSASRTTERHWLTPWRRPQ